MILNYIKSESSISPELVDTSSSKKVVYLRRNIVEVEKTDEMSGETYTVYEYEEVKLTRAEYEEYLNELAAFDFQAQEGRITELETSNAELKEENIRLDGEMISTQLALVEVYEQLLALTEGF